MYDIQKKRECKPTVADDSIVVALRGANVVYDTVALPTIAGCSTAQPQYRIRQEPRRVSLLLHDFDSLPTVDSGKAGGSVESFPVETI